MRNVDLAFFDTETTGLDYETRTPWEFAVIRDNADGTSQRYQAQCPLTNHQLSKLDPESARITHFDERYLKDPAYPVKSPNDVIQDLNRMLMGAHVVGMCPDFDVLNLFLMGPQAKQTWYHQLIDVDIYAAGVFSAKGFYVNLPFNTKAACKFLGIDRNDALVHQAMYDVEMTREYYYRIVDFAHGPKTWIDYQTDGDPDKAIYRTLLTTPKKKD